MLSTKLSERRESSAQRLPQEAREVMAGSTAALKSGEFEKNAANSGFKVPNIKMLNHKNENVFIYDYLAGKPTIISFYRGTWCPYCNMELGVYADLLAEDSSVNMVAVSPELPEISNEKLDPAALPFTVLSDIGNDLAKAMNLSFKLPEDLVEVYKGFGIDVLKSQGNSDNILPMPATYIVDAEGVIVKAWIDADYTYRAEPEEVIAAYKAL